MKLNELEKIFQTLEECKEMYQDFIMPEKRGFKSKLPELRKKLGAIKALITAAKKETIMNKDK